MLFKKISAWSSSRRGKPEADNPSARSVTPAEQFIDVDAACTPAPSKPSHRSSHPTALSTKPSHSVRSDPPAAGAGTDSRPGIIQRWRDSRNSRKAREIDFGKRDTIIPEGWEEYAREAEASEAEARRAHNEALAKKDAAANARYAAGKAAAATLPATASVPANPPIAAPSIPVAASFEPAALTVALKPPAPLTAVGTPAPHHHTAAPSASTAPAPLAANSSRVHGDFLNTQPFNHELTAPLPPLQTAGIAASSPPDAVLPATPEPIAVTPPAPAPIAASPAHAIEPAVVAEAASAEKVEAAVEAAASHKPNWLNRVGKGKVAAGSIGALGAVGVGVWAWKEFVAKPDALPQQHGK